MNLIWQQDKTIEKRLDGSYNVYYLDLPYNVCTKDVDPHGLFDIADVEAFWNELPEGDPLKLVQEEIIVEELE